MNELNQLKDLLKIMKAVEILEYHDKNYLHGDKKLRSEQLQKNIEECQFLVNKIGEQIKPIQ